MEKLGRVVRRLRRTGARAATTSIGAALGAVIALTAIASPLPGADADAAAVLADVAVAGTMARPIDALATLGWGDRPTFTTAFAVGRNEATPPARLATSTLLAPQATVVERGGRTYRAVLGTLIDAEGHAWRQVAATVTAYTPCRDECDDDPDVTATGTNALITRGIAADPRAIPYRSLVRVPGYGDARVDDTGGAMRRDFAHGEIHIDVRIPRRDEAGRWRSEAECVRLARAIGVRHETVLVRVP